MQNILADITAQNWILALFIRDDGERFLLGSGAYEFKKSLQHFQPNTYANDIVELQGTDGQLLAGQVRRTAPQPFDGYIADQTMSQQMTESRRRAFLMFFRKKHFYTVAYIMPNGTAIQRRRGYITDAPAVAEMIQRWPEYHVALNFEDPNYYEYAEDEDGNPIYAHEVELAIAGASVGGLLWDEDGVVWDGGIDWRTLQTVQGPFINLDNELDMRAPLSSVELLGNTTQNGTPTPSAPVAVQTTTGEQVVKMCGKNLFSYPYANTTKTTNGITFTNNGDGTVSASGTATADAIFWLDNQVWSYSTSNTCISAGTYTISKTGDADCRVYVSIYGKTQGIIGTTDSGASDASFTISEDVSLTNRLVVKFGKTVNGFVFKPQLELGSTATAYEPYQGQSYEVNLGSIELCKLGDYQDKIYKSGDSWYKHKEVGKYVLSGASGENWYISSNAMKCNNLTDLGYPEMASGYPYNAEPTATLYCNYGIQAKAQSIATTTTSGKIGLGIINTGDGASSIYVSKGSYTVGSWRALIASTPLICYYALATPTDTQITNQALIDQLDALASSTLFVGENNIALVPSGGAQGELKIIYPTDYALTGGAIWAVGGSGGQNIITVDGVDSAFPVWEVIGPATNPTLTNTTTGQSITWTGIVPNGQSLIIDMAEQTATMAGANVFQFVDGQWIQLDAGNNTLTYTATGANAPSILSWNGVVG